jgi:transposase
MRAISSADRQNVISLLLSSHSIRKVASITGISKSTVGSISQGLQISNRNNKEGRPPKLSKYDQRRIIAQITHGKMDNAVQVTEHINSIIQQPVSTQCVRNVLKKHAFKAVVKVKKPLLKMKHRKNRLAFALAYQNLTVDDWKMMLWSDETKINLFGSDGHPYVWKRKGEPLSDRTTQPSVKFGGGNIMIWACMGWNGVGFLAKVEGRMDAKQYVVDILDHHVHQSITKLDIPEDQILFQQDNDPKHTSRLAHTWFSDHGIRLLNWPAQSPDLNPIEHLWKILKQKLRKYADPPKGVGELCERVKTEWGKITAEECQRLIESMPRRLHAVIKAKGGHIKY